MSLSNVQNGCVMIFGFCVFLFSNLVFPFLFFWDNIVFVLVLSFFLSLHYALMFFLWLADKFRDKGLMLCGDLGIRLKNIIWFNIGVFLAELFLFFFLLFGQFGIFAVGIMETGDECCSVVEVHGHTSTGKGYDLDILSSDILLLCGMGDVDL